MIPVRAKSSVGRTAPRTAAVCEDNPPPVQALKDRRHRKRVFEENLRLRDWMDCELNALGLRAYPSRGNLNLAEFTNPASDAREATLALRRKGISIRRFESPAYERFIRITIGGNLIFAPRSRRFRSICTNAKSDRRIDSPLGMSMRGKI